MTGEDERFRIRESRRRKCDLCPDDLDVEAFGVYQWTAGWVLRRAGGGGHGISLPERERRWAHGTCVELAVAQAAGKAAPAEQGTLFA